MLFFLFTEIQTFMDKKVLGQIYICGTFSQAPKTFNYTLSASLNHLFFYNIGRWICVNAISLEFQHCIGGWNGVGSNFDTDNSAISKLLLKNMEN